MVSPGDHRDLTCGHDHHQAWPDYDNRQVYISPEKMKQRVWVIHWFESGSLDDTSAGKGEDLHQFNSRHAKSQRTIRLTDVTLKYKSIHFSEGIKYWDPMIRQCKRNDSMTWWQYQGKAWEKESIWNILIKNVDDMKSMDKLKSIEKVKWWWIRLWKRYNDIDIIRFILSQKDQLFEEWDLLTQTPRSYIIVCRAMDIIHFIIKYNLHVLLYCIHFLLFKRP